MKNATVALLAAAFLSFALLVPVPRGFAGQSGPAEEPGFFAGLGSIVFSVLLIPTKLVTCLGTQASAAAFYVATYDVKGAYDEGTNGRDIGETARRSCTGSWVVSPQQVARDYGE
jgi:hypothetical protein